MAEIKMRPAVYSNHRRKDGSYPVKVVIYFKGKERKMATHIVAEQKDLTRSLHIKQGDVLDAVQDLIIDMRAACRDIPYFDLQYRDVDFVVEYIKGKFAKKEFSLDFFAFGYEFIQQKKESTRKQYVQPLRAFARFIGSDHIDINAITSRMVDEFIDYMNNEPRLYWDKRDRVLKEGRKPKKAGGQASRHISKLATIYQAAKKKYNNEDTDCIVIPRTPFEGHKVSVSSPQGQKPLRNEIIQRLINARPASYKQRCAIDAAVISFGLMGINLADLYEVKAPKDGVLIYYRKKTRDRRADRAEMQIDVPSCLNPYIARLRGRGDAWLNVLREWVPEHRICRAVNRGLEKWCEAEGIERFTFYALRKSWGTIARRYADKAIVDEGLAHVGDFTLTDIYAERPWERINEANRRVLECFEWPED
jgi:hypothetical protein